MTTIEGRIERRGGGVAALRRVAWGAVFAGAFVALAINFLLGVLGLAIGATTIDPATGDTPSREALGVGAGIWWLVIGVVALFAGGFAAGRLAGLRRRWEGPMHGVVTWAVWASLASLVIGPVLGRMVPPMLVGTPELAEAHAGALAMMAWWSFFYFLLAGIAAGAGGMLGAASLRQQAGEPSPHRVAAPATAPLG